MHLRGEDAEMVKRGIGDNSYQAAGKNVRLKETDGNVIAPFRTHFGDDEIGMFRHVLDMEARRLVSDGSCRRAFAGETELSYRVAPCRRKCHFPQLGGWTIPEPQAP